MFFHLQLQKPFEDDATSRFQVHVLLTSDHSLYNTLDHELDASFLKINQLATAPCISLINYSRTYNIVSVVSKARNYKIVHYKRFSRIVITK